MYKFFACYDLGGLIIYEPWHTKGFFLISIFHMYMYIKATLVV